MSLLVRQVRKKQVFEDDNRKEKRKQRISKNKKNPQEREKRIKLPKKGREKLCLMNMD